MWSWNPTSSTHSFPGYPHMQPLSGHTQFPAPRLSAGYQPSTPAGYYPHVPNVGYSASGTRLVTPQTLPLSAHWQGSHVRTPEEGIQYIQQPEVLQSPGNHHLHESPLQNSFSSQEEPFQRNLYSQQQQVFQVSPGSQSGLGNFPGGAPSPMHSYHQQALPTEAHTPAFQSSPTLAAGFQTANTTFQKTVTPSTTSPFQSQLPLDSHQPELGRPQIEAPSSDLLPREEAGYSAPHAQSNPFSMDYLLRDRPSVEEEYSAEITPGSGYSNSFTPRPQSVNVTPQSDHVTPQSDHMTPQSTPIHPFETTPQNEHPFSPPELVHINTINQTTNESLSMSHDSHKDSSRSSIEEDKGSLCTKESKPVSFQLAVPAAEQAMSDHSEEQSKESLIRHQRNRGYESSDDDEVFLPDNRGKLPAQPENPEIEPPAPSTQSCEPETKSHDLAIESHDQAIKPQEPVVIKRGRGTAKTLNMEKLQLPLSQGWRRLVRKRIGPDQVRVDISYIAPWPNGKKLRTFPEIQAQLDLTDSELTIENFTFSRKVDLGEVLDWGPVNESSPRRGRRGRGRGRGAHVQEGTTSAEGIPPTATPPKVRGRGRGRGRGGRPRKTAESATVRGEQFPIVQHSSTNSKPEHINTIGAISGDTAKALIQKAINETDIKISGHGAGIESATPTGSARAPDQREEKPAASELNQSSNHHTNLEFHMHTPSTLQGSGRPGRGRKRKSTTATEHAQKRARGRPKGSRRGHTQQGPPRPLLPAEGQASQTSDTQGPSQTAKIQEEKRRQLLLKARADKARKKEGRSYQRSLSVSQRKMAQRQRRDRERKLMKQARERQDKLTKQREAEDREMRKQSVAKQREVDNQRRARERTLKLLAHLKQQEMERNRRLYIQQLEMEKIAQLKRPIEDLEVRDSSALPMLAPMGWVQLPAQAFADLLMLCEFGRSFAEFLEVEGEFPSLASMYLSLYNHEQGQAVVQLLSQLLKAVLHDLGTRVCTESGISLGHVEITPLTVSELLRLYLTSAKTISPQLSQVTAALRTSPVQGLRPSEKVLIFSYLLNVLLDSVSLMKEVDTRMEQLATLRREKWKISLKMKRFRSRLSSVFGIGNKTKPIAYSGRGRPPKRSLIGGLPANGEESSDEGEVPDEEQVPVVSDGEYSEEQSDEETPETKDELQSRLKTLKKKFVAVRTRIHSSSRLMRKFPLGQDRYARQYWVLPSVGGVIIEGVETSLDKNLQVMDSVVAKDNSSQSDLMAVETSGLDVVEKNQSNERMETDQSSERAGTAQSDDAIDAPPLETTLPSNETIETESNLPMEHSSDVSIKAIEESVTAETTPTGHSPSHEAVPMDTVPESLNNITDQCSSHDLTTSIEDKNGRSSSPASQHSSITPDSQIQEHIVQPAPDSLLVPQPASVPEGESLVNSFPSTTESTREESQLTCSESLTREESKDSSPPHSNWFSLSQRTPCEVVEVSYQSPAQQFVVAGATPQYAYMTPDGQIITPAALSQMGYSIVGNSLVQTQQPQPQYIAVNSNSGLVVGGQPAAVQYAVGEGATAGVQYLAVGNGGYIAVGAGQQVVMQENGQVVVVQNGQGLVPATAPSLVKQEPEQPESDEEVKQEELREETPPPAPPPAVDSEATTSPEEPPPATDQFVTAVVPGGPDGAPQYVSLPADPRVISGHCSYAVLQQPDGSQQIVLVENNTSSSSASGVQGDEGAPAMIETPPHRLMNNETEGESYMTAITLMYAQEPAPRYVPEKRPSPVRGDEKQLRDLLEEQDIELTHGWWSVTGGETIERLLRTLCSRGVREKCLLKYLQKNKDTVTNILNPEILKSFEQLFREELNPERGDQTEGNGESTSDGVKMESDEPPNDSTSQTLQLTNQIIPEGSHDQNDPAFPEFCQTLLFKAVDYLLDMQQRLVTARLTNDGVELWEELRDHVTRLGHTSEALSLIGKHLLELEESINRFYLKPPFRNKKLYQEDQESSSKSRKDRSLAVRRENAALELPCPGLLSWREAVGMCSSASQLSVCMSELEVCIAWEKSGTIVFCRVCHSGENESQLLLCDRCDKGTHTYCCKPKLSIVPEGDWFCYSCVTSNGRYRPCYTCDSKRGVLLSCAVCPRNYHKRCLNPPLNKMPTNLWKCPNCKHKPIPQSKLKNSRKKEKASGKTNDEICQVLLEELRSHDQAWPFLEPVERKKFPAYYKVVKKPMDLLTIENNLEDGKYSDDIELFAADTRLIFSNCSYYNEDQSEIGKAGHSMSDFFEDKWRMSN